MDTLATPLDDGFDALAWVARNRAGLGRIDYSADDHQALRLRLRQRLPAALPGWNETLADSDAGHDFATLITDLAALMLANLAAHADHRANEGFLRTAREPRALMDLAALADLRLAPGASAATLQAFFAKDGAAGTLPAGTRLSHTTTARQELVFETAFALAVDASRNAMRLRGWNRSARVLALRQGATAAQDLGADMDAEYGGLRAGLPLVFATASRRAALPLAASVTVGAPGAALTRLRWPAGAVAADFDLPIAGLTIEARPRQVAMLAGATRSDELALGSNRLPLIDASAFAVGDVALLQSGGLRLGARIVARSGQALTLGRGLPVALRRSQTELLQARWCGQSWSPVRAGSTELHRAPRGHQVYPHTPAAGDLLLIEDAGGVELVTVAAVGASQILINEPLARTLRPGANSVDNNLVLRYYALDPDSAATLRSAAAPVLLQELPGVYSGGATLLELDRACDALVSGSSVAVSDGTQYHAAVVDAVDSVDKRTRVRLQGTVPGTLHAARTALFGAFEHRMRVQGWDRSEAWLEAGATEIEIDGAPAGLMPGLQLVLGDGRSAEGARIARVQAVSAAQVLQRVSLARPTEGRYFLADLQVHGNVAAVSHGAADRDEIVGSGNPQLAPQRFMLKRSPLAQVPDTAAPLGLAPALEVFIGGRRWQRVDTLADSAALDTHYALDIDEQQRAQLVFGDGVHGAPPPSGRDNIIARYRVGLGRAANLDAGTLIKAVAPPPFIASSINPLAASGGAECDTPAAARERVMRHTRTLGRAVTLADHAELALAFGGVAAARADWVTEGRGGGARRLLTVTVASTGGQLLAPPQREALLAFLSARSAEPQRVRLRSHRRWPVHLSLQVTLQPDFTQAAVQSALLQALGSGSAADGTPAYFAFERRALGTALVLSDVYRVAEGVPGVDHALALAFHAEGAAAAVADRIAVPADAQASGGHASDAAVGRLDLALTGGLPT